LFHSVPTAPSENTPIFPAASTGPPLDGHKGSEAPRNSLPRFSGLSEHIYSVSISSPLLLPLLLTAAFVEAGHPSLKNLVPYKGVFPVDRRGASPPNLGRKGPPTPCFFWCCCPHVPSFDATPWHQLFAKSGFRLVPHFMLFSFFLERLRSPPPPHTFRSIR